MKVAVFGASGKTGSLVLSECVARGWTVNALVGDVARFGRRVGIEAFQGDARNPELVSRVLEGTDAVLCCLGMRDISIPATDFSDSVRTIVRIMKEGRVKRIVAIGSSRLLAPPSPGPAAGDDTPNPFANIAAEHQRNSETLQGSGLEWTLMCPIALKEDIPPGSGKYMYEAVPPGSDETGYADLAHTMVKLVEVAESHGKRVGIASYLYRLK